MSSDFENWWKDRGYLDGNRPGSMAEKWAIEAAEQKAAEQRMVDDARADAKAIWALADFYLPPDVKEFFARRKMEETGCEMWRQAFAAGWRASLR